MSIDVGHLGLFLSQHFDREVFAAMEKAGFSKVRTSHGDVVQRLLEGPQPVTAIAKDLGVTQQAISKLLGEMTVLGLVEPAGQFDDKRQRRVQLTARGKKCVQVSRAARLAVSNKLARQLGRSTLQRLETQLTGALGGLDAVTDRRVKLPRHH
ncbi:MAG: hypothetical protein DI536_27945 [Archangium gephyra]|uniref:HTH marR-type domain-containing protein n=1 Tax=Archangium gephyra TaxID=48 RepID=A0A2W5SVD8_9BACT|nr:MAG: hypothetical protein DI536_27945 [Archangium gephyra]